MLDKEPLSFPSRNMLAYHPGVSDRQLWALGMVVVQWSMTEYLIETDARKLIEGDEPAAVELKKKRNFQQMLSFWNEQIQLKRSEPLRSLLLALVPRLQDMSAQRDEVIHRMWGGGYESMSSLPGPVLPTTDAGLMPNPGEKFKTSGQLIPFTWKATFQRLKRMASEMSALNRDVLVLLLLPLGDVRSGDQSQASP